jgi:hypothetical protein
MPTCDENQHATASAPLADPADQPPAAPLSHKEQKAAAAKARKLANRAARAANPATSLHEQPNVVAAMKVRPCATPAVCCLPPPRSHAVG